MLRGGDRPGAALYHILFLYCFSFLLRRIVSYRIVSLFPCPQASSSARQSAILTSISIITLILILTLTLSITSAHTRYIYPFRIQTQISHITIYLWLFDFRSSIFFDSYIGPLGFRTITHFECACSVHVPPTWLGVCVSATTLRLRMLIFLARPLSFFQRRLHLPFLQLLVFFFSFHFFLF